MPEIQAAEKVESAPTTPVQYDGWDEKGNPIVTAKAQPQKVQDPAPADPPKEEPSAPEKAETAPESEPGKEAQENVPSPKESKRVNELIRERGKWKARAEEAEQKLAQRNAESQPAKPAAEPAKAPAANAKPTPEDKNEKGEAKYKTYEDFLEALSDWKADEKLRQYEAKRQQESVQQYWKGEFDKAAKKYPDFEPKAKEALAILVDPQVPDMVRSWFDQNPLATDLMYVIGGTEESLHDFAEKARSNPAAAIRMLALMEHEITVELAKDKPKAEPEKKATPAEPQPRAPKPVSEVGGRGAPPEDARVAAARSGDFAAFEREENRLKFARK